MRPDKLLKILKLKLNQAIYNLTYFPFSIHDHHNTKFVCDIQSGDAFLHVRCILSCDVDVAGQL